MSTILDALSRAERERQMGEIPAIERTLLEHPRLPAQTPRDKLSLRWVLLGLGLILCGALVAILASTLREKATSPLALEQERGAAAAPLPAPNPASEQTPGPAATAELQAARDTPRNERVADERAAAPAPHSAGGRVHDRPASVKNLASARAQASTGKRSPAEAPANKSSVAPPMVVKTTEAPTPTARTTDSAVSAKPASAALPWINELPANVRQELPAISLGGYIYSANVAERSILINGKLLREGDQLAPGLRLEQMRPDGVVFGYKEQRFRMRY